MVDILQERRSHIRQTGQEPFEIRCEKQSLAGSVSQRACVFCGSRVVLYPIADALHLIHGPVGCAAYTWDIRGSLSSGPQLHRLSFTTDLREKDIVYGGEKKLFTALSELIVRHTPKAAFVYGTCIVGLIGDDIEAVCKRASAQFGIPVIPVHSEGFKGSKKDGYQAACEAMFQLVGSLDTASIPERSINIMGEFNLAGEAWIIREYYAKMGVNVVATITGDGRVDDIGRSHGAALNVVQCSGSMMHLARLMKEKYQIPFIKVSYFGIEDVSRALYDVADHFGGGELRSAAAQVIQEEVRELLPAIATYRQELTGKRAAIYTGGAFKAFSLVRALRTLGIQTVVAGSQTGNREDYEQLAELCDPGTVIVDDTNPLELARFVDEQRVDLLIGGVKERPIAFKLGVAFCDHNHERKEPLAGFIGMERFAHEVYSSVMSPVWRFSKAWQSRQRGASLLRCSATGNDVNTESAIR